MASVNGFTSLLAATLDPSTHDLGESIVMSVLYLINEPKTRYDICNSTCIHMRYTMLYVHCIMLYIELNLLLLFIYVIPDAM